MTEGTQEICGAVRDGQPPCPNPTPCADHCGAKTRAGVPCPNPPMPNGRCYSHGGPTPTGPALPQFKHGLYSKSMPARLAARYHEALEDAALIELRREAAITTVLVDEALARLDSGETESHWVRLRKAWSAYLAADEGERSLALAAVGQLIVDGAREVEAVRELRSAINGKARIAESERRRLLEASQLITAEQLVALVAALASAVVAEVPDREARTRLLDRFDRALSAGTGGASPS